MAVAKPDREQALARTALALMGECRVVPTPENFELFYIYASGENAALSRLMGEMMETRKRFTSETLQDMRLRHLPGARAVQMLESLGAGMSESLGAMLGKLEAAGQDASEYGRTLSAAHGELGDGCDPGKLAPLVGGLMAATKAMQDRTRNLEVELQRSSEQVNELKEKLDDVRKESLTDPLTGVANRKAFDAALQNAAEQWAKSGEPSSLLLCDIDHFKKFNDTWGHQTGDRVLCLVANCVAENVKGKDTAARFGGEEFAIVLRGTALADAVTLADGIRATVEGKKLVKKSTGEILGTVTVSFGVAQFSGGDTPETIVRRADTCLYAAKHAGRNLVIGEDDPRLAAAERGAA